METADIWYELGQTCWDMGLLDKAAYAYLQAIEHNMRTGSLYNNLAEVYVQQENFARALIFLKQSLEYFENPKDLASVWGRIGNVYTRLNEYGKAIQAFQKADEINPKQTLEIAAVPNVAEIRSTIQAEASLSGSNSEMGVDAGEETSEPQGLQNSSVGDHPQESGNDPLEEDPTPELAIRTAEESPDTWNELGLILFKVGAYDDAIDAYEKAIAINPTVGYLYSNLGQVYATQGKLAEAVLKYEKSLRLLTNNREKSICWTRMGDLYRQLSRPESAKPAYQLAEILNQAVTICTNEYKQIRLELINSGSEPVRGLDEIGDLVQSVRNFGIIEPLIVCPGRNAPGKYQLIAGRRRLEAARQAGLTEVPVIVRKASNVEILEISISENIHHMAVSPFELAQQYSRLANEFEFTIEEISACVGRSLHSVANTMKMIEAANIVESQKDQKAISSGQQVINQTLADLQAPEPNVLGKLGDLALQFSFDEEELELPVAELEELTGSDPVPTLWYLDNGDIEAPPSREEEAFSEPSSLLMRARLVLNSDRNMKRIWTESSYRA